MAEDSYPICPRCKMEALRLIRSNTECNWCSDREPLTRDKWDAAMKRINEAQLKIQRDAFIKMISDRFGLSKQEIKEIRKGSGLK